jgi:hypothetical protein
MGSTADRMLLAHCVGHAPLQEECHDALEKEEGGRRKEGVALAYHLFQSSRQ